MRLTRLPAIVMLLAALSPALSSAQYARAPMSGAQLKKLVAYVKAKGQDGLIFPGITDALGLTHKGEKITVRQAVIRDPAGNDHAFAPLKSGNYLFIFTDHGKLEVHAYYVGPTLALIKVVLNSHKDGISVVRDMTAQQGLDAELTFFAGLVNQQ